VKRILLHTPVEIDSSRYYRSMLPYRHCAKALADLDILLTISEIVDLDTKFDAVICHREVPVAVIQHLAARQRQGCKFVWDSDDDWWNVPGWSRMHYTQGQMDLFDLTLRSCDVAWCSTEPLAKLVGSKGVVVPNLIDLNDWKGGWPHPDDDGGPIRVWYGGSSTHEGDLHIVEEAILEVAKIYGDRVHFHFTGFIPRRVQAFLFPRQATLHPWVPLADYGRMLAFIRPHVGICPLAGVVFNESKSQIKLMEMNLAGMAVVASNSKAYTNAACQVDGHDEWVANLYSMIGDPYLRKSYFDEDRETISSKFSWQSVNPWIEAFKSIVDA